MPYKIVLSKKAEFDLKSLQKSEPNSYKKAILLIKEIAENPREGRGKPSLKKYGLAGFYSRKISEKHRLVYAINDGVLCVDIVSARGHYNDK